MILNNKEKMVRWTKHLRVVNNFYKNVRAQNVKKPLMLAMMILRMRAMESLNNAKKPEKNVKSYLMIKKEEKMMENVTN